MIRKSVCIASFVGALTAATVLMPAPQKLQAQASQTAPATIEASIDNFSFSPGTLTVAIGATVTWTNRDDIPHTVFSTEGVFKSRVMDTDEKFSYTFSKAGVFPYFCSIHPKMTGKVVVQ
jgi:plastocyanin